MPRISQTTVTATGTTTPRTLAARFGEVLNVKDFGAVGDGTTDDTAAFTAALAVLNARSRVDTNEYGTGAGGTLFVPRGKYKITSPLSVTQDSISIIGEGIGATTLYVRLASNYTTTDFLSVLNTGVGAGGGGGLRFLLADLTISSESNWGATAGFRDGVYIDGATYPTMERVYIRGAYRYGLRVGGSYHGTFSHIETSYCGDSGVRTEKSSSSVEATTHAFYHLFTHYNVKHGVYVGSSCVQMSFHDLITEFNGYAAGGGVPASGDGIRTGDVGDDSGCDVFISNLYTEQNAGWDVNVGVGAAGAAWHGMTIVGGRASAGNLKDGAYGFYYGNRATGLIDIRLDHGTYAVATGLDTFSLDENCRTSITGQGSAQLCAAPTYRTGGAGINDYGGGTISWPDSNATVQLLGRYIPRAGYTASGGASVPLYARGAAPTSGAFDTADVVFNRLPGNYRSLGWVNVSGGSPGTFRAMPLNWGFVSSDRGDSSQTLAVDGGDPPIQRFATALTQNRTVTLSTTGAKFGDMWRIVRSGGDTGGPWTLDVGGLKSLSAGQWCDVAYEEGAAWRLVGYGTL